MIARAVSAVSPMPPVASAYGVVALPAGSAWTTLIKGYREAVQQTVNWWLDSLPVADASRTRATIAAHNTPSITVGIGVGSGYDYGFSYSGWYPFLTFDDRQPEYREIMVRHETGHYITHMMVGDAAYQYLANNGPVDTLHTVGTIARGIRESLNEEMPTRASSS